MGRQQRVESVSCRPEQRSFGRQPTRSPGGAAPERQLSAPDRSVTRPHASEAPARTGQKFAFGGGNRPTRRGHPARDGNAAEAGTSLHGTSDCCDRQSSHRVSTAERGLWPKAGADGKATAAAVRSSTAAFRAVAMSNPSRLAAPTCEASAARPRIMGGLAPRGLASALRGRYTGQPAWQPRRGSRPLTAMIRYTAQPRDLTRATSQFPAQMNSFIAWRTEFTAPVRGLPSRSSEFPFSMN